MANYTPLAAILNHPNVIDNYLNDVISTQNVLLWWLMGKPVSVGVGNAPKPTAKQFIREVEGGSRFEVPLLLDTNPNLKAYAKDDSFDLTANDLGDRAYYDIKSLGGPIPIYGFDIDVSGSNKTNLVNITDAFLEQAELGIVNLFTTQLLAATGTAGANDWASLYDIIAQDPTADSIGGISSATYSKWRNDYYNATGRSFATYGVGDLTTRQVNCTFGKKGPQLVIMDKTNYGYLSSKLVANQRYVPDAELVKAGFKGMEFQGMSVMFEAAATTGSTLLIDPEGLELGKLKNAFLKTEEPVRVPNADLFVYFIKARGNVICRSRRTQGIIYNATTA